MDPTGFPTSLTEFQKVLPDDAACAKYLESLRWPNGFTCPECGTRGEPYRFPTRSSVVLRCRSCKKSTSLTAGTIMQASPTPLSIWFLGAYLVTTEKEGISALQFQRQLGISSYATAFTILHKLRAGIVPADQDPIGGKYPVEVDQCLIGGDKLGKDRGTHRAMHVIGALEVRTRKNSPTKRGKEHVLGRPIKGLENAGLLRLRAIKTPRPSTMVRFVKDVIAVGSTVRTNALSESDLQHLGLTHKFLAAGNEADTIETPLPMIQHVFLDLKDWIIGTHRGTIAPHYLQAYLNEYAFRFNRRLYPMTTIRSVLGLTAKEIPQT